MKRFWGILLTAGLLVMTPGYGSAQPQAGKGISPTTQPKAAAETGATPRAAESYTTEEKQAYQEKVAADLAKVEKGIADLQGDYETVKPQMKRTVLRVLHGLKKQHFAAQNQLTALEKASAKDWGGLKAKMDKTMTELTVAYQDAKTKLQ